MRENDYAEHGVTCEECEEFEPAGFECGGICHAGDDLFFQETGVTPQRIFVSMFSDASKCPCFDPTERCLARIESERDPAKDRGVTAGVDFPGSL